MCQGPAYAPIRRFPLDQSEARAKFFSEQEAFCVLPLHDMGVVADVGVTRDTSGDVIHVAVANPVELLSVRERGRTCSVVDLYDVFPDRRHLFKPRINVVPLGGALRHSVLLHEEMVSDSSFVFFLINSFILSPDRHAAHGRLRERGSASFVGHWRERHQVIHQQQAASKRRSPSHYYIITC